jgi:hypothetical protein
VVLCREPYVGRSGLYSEQLVQFILVYICIFSVPPYRHASNLYSKDPSYGFLPAVQTKVLRFTAANTFSRYSPFLPDSSCIMIFASIANRKYLKHNYSTWTCRNNWMSSGVFQIDHSISLPVFGDLQPCVYICTDTPAHARAHTDLKKDQKSYLPN